VTDQEHHEDHDDRYDLDGQHDDWYDRFDDDHRPGADDGAEPALSTRLPTSPLAALYRLLLHQQLTKGRLALAIVLGILSVVVATLIAANTPEADRTVTTVGFISAFGLGLSIPILSLVIASSSLGQLVEDQTLVYLWLRPNPRWLLALASWAAAATVTVPATSLPLTVAAAAGTRELDAVVAVAISSILATVAYSALFTLLGLVLRRALIWGLVYVFVWEFFVARVGQGAARLSINTYPLSVLARMADVELPLAERALLTGTAVPVAVTVVAVALTAWRLRRAEVA
jgi:ABC-2 type transport system permease protein